MSLNLDNAMVYYIQKEYYSCLANIFVISSKYINPQQEDINIGVCIKALEDRKQSIDDFPEGFFKNHTLSNN